MERGDLQSKQVRPQSARRTLALAFILSASLTHVMHAQRLLIPATPEPSGSGARALGQSAFIAVADDATAASWNPAGLINLGRAQASFVGAWRTAANDPSALPGGLWLYDESRWSEAQINFMSYAQPLEIGSTDVVLSVNYHQVYDLGLEFTTDVSEITSEGAIAAYSLAGAVSVPAHPELTVGLSFNWYTDGLFRGYTRKVKLLQPGFGPFGGDLEWTEVLENLRAHNFTLGLLWDAYEKDEKLLSLGLVCHTPFTAESDVTEAISFEDWPPWIEEEGAEDIDLPLSVGAGANYLLSDEFSVAFDLQWTNWSTLGLEQTGGASKLQDTLAARLGFERLRFPRRGGSTVLALRAGVFYEPRPAWGDIMPVYGLSAGFGWTVLERFSLDFAYQYRWGMEELPDFEYRIQEHFFVTSLITYF